MSYMFEVYYRSPVDLERETTLTARVSHLGGRLDFREVPAEDGPGGVCLTFEFDDMDGARGAAETLRAQGEHVEGPTVYAT